MMKKPRSTVNVFSHVRVACKVDKCKKFNSVSSYHWAPSNVN